MWPCPGQRLHGHLSTTTIHDARAGHRQARAMPLIDSDHAGRNSVRRAWQETSHACVKTATVVEILPKSEAAVNLLCLYLLLTYLQQWLQCQVVLVAHHDYSMRWTGRQGLVRIRIFLSTLSAYIRGSRARCHLEHLRSCNNLPGGPAAWYNRGTVEDSSSFGDARLRTPPVAE